MCRLSIKQNILLDQLREQGQRIERLSKAEHDLIKKVHPQVGEIKEGMEVMIAVVKENSENNPSGSQKDGALAGWDVSVSSGRDHAEDLVYELAAE